VVVVIAFVIVIVVDADADADADADVHQVGMISHNNTKDRYLIEFPKDSAIATTTTTAIAASCRALLRVPPLLRMFLLEVMCCPINSA